MKIPPLAISVVGEVLGSYYSSHSKLDRLFRNNGFPSDPPSGNCVEKTQDWLRRANTESNTDAVGLLSGLLGEFANLDRRDDPKWVDSVDKISRGLERAGLSLDRNTGVVTAYRIGETQIPRIVPASNVPIIVILTVNEHETHAILDAFLGVGTRPRTETRGGVTYTELGTHGGCRIVGTVSEMGAGGVGASQQRSREAIDHWHPKAIIAAGIAFGVDETKQGIGDVLVSVQIQEYELGRLNSDGTLTPRGDKPSGSGTLCNRLRITDGVEKRDSTEWPKVRFGLILSGQKLIDNLDYRENLKRQFPEAIGGEMEASGVYASAASSKVDWIIVKAICDWAHQKHSADKDRNQKIAARNAAFVLRSALTPASLYKADNGSTPQEAACSSPLSNYGESAAAVWRAKLEFLLREEAMAIDSSHKFKIQQDIAEAREKLRPLV